MLVERKAWTLMHVNTCQELSRFLFLKLLFFKIAKLRHNLGKQTMEDLFF